MSSPSEHQRPPTAWVVIPNAINLASLGLLTWGAAAEIEHLAHGRSQTVASVLLAIAVICWTLWVWLRSSPSPSEGMLATLLAVMAAAGGALVPFAPVALVFPAVAALGAAMRWRFPIALAVGAVGGVAAFASVALTGHVVGLALGTLAAIFAGLMVGSSRHQVAERASQDARVELETARAEVLRARAEVLSERNHLARELHDVLAHTLAALSLQLEAFSTVVDAEASVSPAVREQLERTRQLVREGLDEARGAVRALREAPVPLEEQLARLCAQQHARFEVSGATRPLPPPVVSNLYRVVQEALTNVMKHAAGAATSVVLRFEPAAVLVTVDNEAVERGGAVHSTSQDGGGGYGLRGITERLEMLGGQVEVGPSAGGWRVAATVPVATSASPAPSGAQSGAPS